MEWPTQLYDIKGIQKYQYYSSNEVIHKDLLKLMYGEMSNDIINSMRQKMHTYENKSINDPVV